jgi:hypothetical protein
MEYSSIVRSLSCNQESDPKAASEPLSDEDRKRVFRE